MFRPSWETGSPRAFLSTSRVRSGVGSLTTVKEAMLGRDVAVAFAVIAALYLIRFVEFHPLQIPGYLLIATYDFVEVGLPVLAPYYPVGFPLFLYLVAIGAAGGARRLQSETEEHGTWTRAAGMACLIVGLLSLSVGVVVGGPIVSPTDNPTPVAITGATGVVFLLAGWWVVSRPSLRALRKN